PVEGSAARWTHRESHGGYVLGLARSLAFFGGRTHRTFPSHRKHQTWFGEKGKGKNSLVAGSCFDPVGGARPREEADRDYQPSHRYRGSSHGHCACCHSRTGKEYSGVAIFWTCTGPLSGVDAAELIREFERQGVRIRPIFQP